MKARGLAGCYRILISRKGGTGEMVHSDHASTLFEMLFSICPCLEYRARPEVFVWNAERRNEVLAACLNSLINPEIQQRFQDCLPFRMRNHSWKGLNYTQTTSLQVCDLGFGRILILDFRFSLIDGYLHPHWHPLYHVDT